MSDDVRCRPMRDSEAGAVSDLIVASFSEFVGAGYSEEGITEFRKFVEPEALETRIADNHFVWVVDVGGTLVGMIEIRDNNHVAFLFVDKAFRCHGVTKDLLRVALDDAIHRCLYHSSAMGFPWFALEQSCYSSQIQ